MTRSVLLLFAGLLVLSGCAAREGGVASGHVTFSEDSYIVRESMPYGPDELWSAVVAAYEALELPRGRANSRRQYEYTTPYLQASGLVYGNKRSDFFSCGSGLGAPIADQSVVTFALRSWVEPDPSGGSLLFTQLEARARRMDVSTNTIECSSTGRLEKALTQEIRARARTGTPNRR